MKSKQTKDFLEKLEPLKTDVNSGSDHDLMDDINKYIPKHDIPLWKEANDKLVEDIDNKLLWGNSKYYQPDISELYVGYETYWIRDMVAEITDGNLVHFTFDIKKLSALLNPFRPFNPKGEMKWTPDLTMSYRTKYLDSDDIISLGFKEVPFFNENEKFSYSKRYSKSEKVIEFANTKNIEVEVITSILIGKQNITINKIRKTSIISYKDLFIGKIKSVNELKKILEWIK